MARISTVLAALAACLCEQLRTDGLPEPCFCGVIPGMAAVADYMGECDTRNGMAWVRLSSTYPAASIGIVDQTPGSCSAGVGYDIEVGVLRRMPLDAEPADEAEVLAVADLQMDDMESARRAILCCTAFRKKDAILGTYTPIGPLGGTVGGSWTLHIGE